MTAIIRAASAHDFLALVPALAGFHPRRSLVCVAFIGNRTAGVLRHDLPADVGDRDAFVAAVVGTVCRMPDVDALVPIVYTDDSFEEHGGLPERALLEMLVDRAEQAGFQIRDALCQASDAWASALDAAGPVSGHPLSLIATSGAADGAPAALQTVVADQSGVMPVADPKTASAVAAAYEQIGAIGSAEEAIAGLGRFADPMELVESVLTRSRRAPDPGLLAWFLHLAGRPAIRDAMMLQIAFGRVIAELSFDATDAAAAGEAVMGVGAASDGMPPRPFAFETRTEIDDLLGRLVMGRTMLRPDRRRLESGLDALRDLIANAPEAARPGACCIAAWLAWALGRGSVAGSFLDAARAIDPDHTMARLLDGFIGSGALPDWAFARADG